jgi:hypothetical protein
MWLFSGLPDDAGHETVLEKPGSDALYSAVKSLMHAPQTEDEEAQQTVAHWVIHIAKPSPIGRWSESKLANRKPPVGIP